MEKNIKVISVLTLSVAPISRATELDVFLVATLCAPAFYSVKTDNFSWGWGEAKSSQNINLAIILHLLPKLRILKNGPPFFQTP
jgi:hypothetical protein